MTDLAVLACVLLVAVSVVTLAWAVRSLVRERSQLLDAVMAKNAAQYATIERQAAKPKLNLWDPADIEEQIAAMEGREPMPSGLDGTT